MEPDRLCTHTWGMYTREDVNGSTPYHGFFFVCVSQSTSFCSRKIYILLMKAVKVTETNFVKKFGIVPLETLLHPLKYFFGV